MVRDIDKWLWSSYLAMVGDVIPPDWLLSQFGASRNKALIQYKNFVREGVGLPPVWEELKYQIYLGGDSFVEKIQAVNLSLGMIII